MIKLHERLRDNVSEFRFVEYNKTLELTHHGLVKAFFEGDQM